MATSLSYRSHWCQPDVSKVELYLLNGPLSYCPTGHMTLPSQVVLIHEDKEPVECQETDHTPIGVGGGEEVQKETWVLEVWHHGRVEVH